MMAPPCAFTNECIYCDASVKAHAELGYLTFINGHMLTLKIILKI